MLIKPIICFISAIICLTNSAKILGVFQLPSYSHYQLGHALLKELAGRGHEVTVISPYEEKEKVNNLTTIFLTDAQENIKAMKVNMFDMANGNMIFDIFLGTIMIPIVENTLKHSSVQSLINSKETFDIVIVERLLNEALQGFCAHFKAHCVILSPLPTTGVTNRQMGNSGLPSYVPELLSRFSTPMNFFERAYNTFGSFLATVWFHIYVLPTNNALMKKYFPNNPDLYDIYYNVSLTLFNSHVSTNPALPMLPNMIDIGSYHIQTPKPLPKDLKEYLDSAKEGVVYFSMGSNLESQDLHDEKREAILKSFAALKYKVLWKWETETLPNQPPNVKLAKWIPQNDLLAHPNIKLFITHGGLLSSLEAVYHGVPIIGIPVYGDQYSNMRNAEHNGYGISVPYAKLTEQTFGDALKEVLNNPKYMETVRMRSKIMHDNQIKPVENAAFWIEYVLRHNGASHLRSAALSLAWYQYFLLDVIVFFAFLIITPIYACCWLCKRQKTTKSVKVKQNKKKQ